MDVENESLGIVISPLQGYDDDCSLRGCHSDGMPHSISKSIRNIREGDFLGERRINRSSGVGFRRQCFHVEFLDISKGGVLKGHNVREDPT